MKARLGLAALAFAALLSTPASALTPAQNWIMGRWSCRIGVSSTTTMSWRYELVACADDCSGAAPAPPIGALGAQRITYVSGDAAHFRFRHASGWITRMDKTGANSMRGAIPGGEVSYALVCTRSMTPRDAVRAPF